MKSQKIRVYKTLAAVNRDFGTTSPEYVNAARVVERTKPRTLVIPRVNPRAFVQAKRSKLQREVDWLNTLVRSVRATADRLGDQIELVNKELARRTRRKKARR